MANLTAARYFARGLATVAIACVSACVRVADPSLGDRDAQSDVESGTDAELPDAGDADGRVLRYYLNNCQYCPVLCYPESKTCEELGVHMYDVCYVEGDTRAYLQRTGRSHPAYIPTESCVFGRYDRRDADVEGGCLLKETFLTCLPAPKTSLGNCGGGPPCSVP